MRQPELGRELGCGIRKNRRKQNRAMRDRFREVVKNGDEPVPVFRMFVELPRLHAFRVLVAVHNVTVEGFQPHGNFMVVHGLAIGRGTIR